MRQSLTIRWRLPRRFAPRNDEFFVMVLRHPKSHFNLALLLTISRFVMVPIFTYYFLADQYHSAVLILILASITDVVDGYLARHMNMGTKIGQILDPLADKFLVLITFLILAAKSVLPAWLVFLVIGRDFYIIFGMLYIYYVERVNIKKLQPSILSKRNTFFQLTLLVFSFLVAYLNSKHPDFKNTLVDVVFQTQHSLIYITALMTSATFVQYTQEGLRMLREFGRRPEES